MAFLTVGLLAHGHMQVISIVLIWQGPTISSLACGVKAIIVEKARWKPLKLFLLKLI